MHSGCSNRPMLTPSEKNTHMEKKKESDKMARKRWFVRLAAAGIAASLSLTPLITYAAEEQTQESGSEEQNSEEDSEGKDSSSEKGEENKKETEDKKDTAGKNAADKKGAKEEAAAGSTSAETAQKEEPADPSSSMAEALDKQRTMVADDDIMMIRIGYQFGDGSFDEWARGTGFVVGNRYIVTRQILADLSTQNSLYQKILTERGENYDRIGVNLSNETEAQKHMVCFITDMNGKEYGIHDISLKSGLALIVTKEIMEMPAVVFANAKTVDLSEGAIVNIKSAGSADDKCAVNTFQGKVVLKEGQTSGYSFSAEGNIGYPIGAPVYDKNGHIVGMVSGDSDPITCFTIKSVETFLTTNGVTFRTIEQIEEQSNLFDQKTSDEDVEKAESVVSDKTALEEAIEKAQAVEEKDYTAETYQAMKEALEEAVRIDANLEVSQEEVDAATENLNSKYDALESTGFFSSLGRTLSSINKKAVISVLLLIAVIIALIKGFFSIKKRQKEENGTSEILPPLEPENEIEEDIPVKNKRKPSRSTSYDDDEIDITSRPSGKAKRKPGDYDPGIEYADEDEPNDILDEDDGSDDTMLLKKSAYLTRTETGKMIPITKNNFIIGKERKKVDYCISGNRTVSRQHCTISMIDNKYYIEDNDSANYTLVNGKRIRPYGNAHIQDGDRITLSDVDFVFHCSEPETDEDLL